MATVRLTGTAWLNYESERVKGVLLVNLPRAGLEVSELIVLLRNFGLVYTAADLILIRNKLLANGVIETV